MAAQKIISREIFDSVLAIEYIKIRSQASGVDMRQPLLFLMLFTWALITAAPLVAQSPTTQPVSNALIQLNLPENVELKVLIDYVSQRLKINFYFDEQLVNQRITLRTPAPVAEDSLLPLLESVLQSRGLVLVDADQPGWKRIVPVANLVNAASTQPTTRPSGVITQVFSIANADPAKLEPLVRSLLTQPGGTIVSVPEQKMLLVTDFVTNVQRIAELLRALDRPRASPIIKFLRIEHVEAAQVSAQVTSLLTARSKSVADSSLIATVEIIPELRTNQLIFVGPPDQVEQAMALVAAFDIELALETKSYRFVSVSPQRMDRLIKELIGPTESKTCYSSVIDAESNLLIVNATPAIHERLSHLKQELDHPTQQVQQSPIRFYKLQNSTAGEVLLTIQAIVADGDNSQMSVQGLGRSNLPRGDSHDSVGSFSPPSPVTVSGLAAPPGSSPEPIESPGVPTQTIKAKDATITADPNTNTIIVVAPPERQFIYEQLIKMLDKRRPQVLIECTVVALDTTGNFQFGVEVAAKGSVGSVDFITFSSFGLSSVGTGGEEGDLGRLTLTPGIGFNGAVIASDVADVVIRALTGNSRAKVVSAPKLLVNDNTAATLASVTEAPFTTTSALTGNTSSTSFGGYSQAGTTITVTPHISESDFLQIEYSIALNSFTDEPQAGASTPPPRRSNQLQSKVTVPDGSTIVVGGLKLKSESNSKTAVPVLGEIPVLEWFFSNRSSKQTESTLFVFIRPVILRDDQFADLKYFSATDVRSAELPGDFPNSEPLLVR